MAKVHEADDNLKVGWYNVAFQAGTMMGNVGERKMKALARDVRDALKKHNLMVLCLCELGEHLIGLQRIKNWKGDGQEQILNELLATVDRLRPPLRLQLISCSYPTYAFIGKPTLQRSAMVSNISSGTVTWVRDLDC